MTESSRPLRPPAAPHTAFITDPSWEILPSASDLARFFPNTANLTGRSIIQCRVKADGWLENCFLVSEDPPGQGFGDAALKMAAMFKMQPRTRDGQPVDGAAVTIPIRFQRAAPPHTAVITNPDWETLPSAAQLQRFFPLGARSTGRATMTCTVGVDGRLSKCLVVSEDPPDQGFGAAALEMASTFKMRPQTRDGKPVDGVSVTIPIRFGMENMTPPAWAHAPTAEELRAVWPPGAADGGGQVDLDCMVTTKGRATDCSVASESPRGQGFGAAALKLAPELALTPGADHGHPISVRSTIPIIFPSPPVRQAGVGSYGDSLTGLVNAPWKTAPSSVEVSAAWPKQASAALAQGAAVLRCQFKADGRLGHCSVEVEQPAGAGFGAAALSLAGRFQVSGGDPVLLAQARVNVPFTFVNPAMGAAAPEWISKANWVKYIAADAMTSLYPTAAVAAGVTTGRGVVECKAAADGSLQGCTPVGEFPAGMGFGAAATAAAAYFVLNPWTDDGRPVEGARVRLPIRFVEAEPATATAPAAPPPTKPGGG